MLNRVAASVVLLVSLVHFPAMAQGIDFNPGNKVTYKTEYGLHTYAERFQWKEFSGGQLLLKETGPIYGIGASVAVTSSTDIVYRAKAETFWGSVDYDGHTMGGAPSTTDVNYLGGKVEGDAGVKYPLSVCSVEPFWGLGYRWWRRDIEHSPTGIGYLEKWQSLYLKAGALAERKFNVGLTVFAEAAVRLSVYNNNTANPGFKISIEPGNTVTPYLEAGLRAGMISASVFYERQDFPRSQPAVIDLDGTILGFEQPESRGHHFGAKAGLVF
jgi:hypothetical protein